MTTTPHPMTRAEWSVAWRFARRLFRSRGATAEIAAMDAARAELGRALPLRFSATATATLWDRNHAHDELQALRRRRREWEFCHYTR